jgi:hypothetical protein
MVCEDVDWIRLMEDSVQWRFLVNMSVGPRVP